MPRKFGGLIETAREKPPAVKRNRNDAIALSKRFSACSCHPQCHQTREVRAVLIFQLVDQFAGWPVVNRRGPETIKARRIGYGFSADHSFAVIIDEGDAENLAIGPLDEFYLWPALNTEGPGATCSATAARTGWRVDDITDIAKQPMQGRYDNLP